MGNQNELTTEQKLVKKGKVAPRITPEIIDSTIMSRGFHRLSGTLTVCVLTLGNGFTVTGESACVSEENFDEEIGNDIAFKNAREKIWVLEGYRLASELSKVGDNFLDRLKVEAVELGEKLLRLRQAVVKDLVPSEEKQILRAQAGIMEEYLDMLNSRILRAEKAEG